jgi:hypothetical protein
MRKTKKKNAPNSGKTKTASGKEEAFFELDGNVYLVEKRNGKETSRSEIDGAVVLQCLVGILEKAMSDDEVRRVLKNEYAIRKTR